MAAEFAIKAASSNLVADLTGSDPSGNIIGFPLRQPYTLNVNQRWIQVPFAGGVRLQTHGQAGGLAVDVFAGADNGSVIGDTAAAAATFIVKRAGPVGSGVFTIQDENEEYFWTLRNRRAGADIVLQHGPVDPTTQYWQIVRA